MLDSIIEIDPAYFNLQHLVHPRIGLIKSLRRRRLDTMCPNHYIYIGERQSSSRGLHTPALNTDEREALSAAGMNIEQRSANIACICECIERYCSGHISFQNLVRGCEHDLKKSGHDFMRHEQFDYFSKDQYLSGLQFDQWLPTSTFNWIESRSLHDGRIFFLPAQLVYVPYHYYPSEAVLCEQISSGVACHRSTVSAALAGLCEVIERDSLMRYWLTMVPVPTIANKSIVGISSEIDLLLDRIASISGLELTIKDISFDIHIPTVLCIIRSRDSTSNVASAFAAATHVDFIKAILKALNELLGTYSLAYQLWSDKNQRSKTSIGPERWNRTYTSRDHVLNFAFHEILSYIDWIDGGKEVTLDEAMEHYADSPTDGLSDQEALDICLQRLETCNLEAFCTDLTVPEIDELGFKVVRVNIPGCLPLNGEHRHRPLGCKRLQTFLEQMGSKFSGSLNPVPHPYP